MTLASPWLLEAMSEGGRPSSKRVVSVVGLLVLAPLLLTACLRFAPEHFGTTFVVWVAACCGVYIVPTGVQAWRKGPTEPKEEVHG